MPHIFTLEQNFLLVTGAKSKIFYCQCNISFIYICINTLFVVVHLRSDEIVITKEPYQSSLKLQRLIGVFSLATYFTCLFLKGCVFSKSSLSALSVDKAFCEGADDWGQHTTQTGETAQAALTSKWLWVLQGLVCRQCLLFVPQHPLPIPLLLIIPRYWRFSRRCCFVFWLILEVIYSHTWDSSFECVWEEMPERKTHPQSTFSI